MEKKLFAVAIALSMSLEFLWGGAVIADTSPDYLDPESGISESEEKIPYTENDEDQVADQDADTENDGVSFNPYVFEVDENDEVNASVQLQPGLMTIEGIADLFDAATDINQNSTVIDFGDITEGNSTFTNVTIINETIPLTVQAPEIMAGNYVENGNCIVMFRNYDYEAEYFDACVYTTKSVTEPIGTRVVNGTTYYMAGIGTFDMDHYVIGVSNSTDGQIILANVPMYFANNKIPAGNTTVYLSVIAGESSESDLFRSNVISDPDANKTEELIPIDSKDLSVVIQTNDRTYTGESLFPPIAIYNSTNYAKLVEDRDYEVVYDDMIDAGNYTITVNGLGNFTGTRAVPFTVERARFNENFTAMLVEQEAMEYSGDELKPDVSVWHNDVELVEGKDFELDFINNTDVGEAVVVAEGIGNYDGSMEAGFLINPVTVWEGNSEIIGLNRTFEFTGENITPAITIICQTETSNRTLINGTDYNMTITNNMDVGLAYVGISMMGNYRGNFTDTFRIIPASLTYNTTISLNPDSFQFNGSALQPDVTVTHNGRTLGEDDFRTVFINNTDAGSANVLVIGQGNYSGASSAKFAINPVDINSTEANVDVRMEDDSFTFTGEAIYPSLNVTAGGKSLKEGTDYDIAYFNNTDAGTGRVVIVGQGNYAGNTTLNFTIEPRNIAVNSTVVTISTNIDKFQGYPLVPNVSVFTGGKTLVNGTDYDVELVNNVEAGRAVVIVTGKGNYNGTHINYFTIDPQSITNRIVNVTLNTTSCKFTGEAIEPKVTVTINDKYVLEEGVHFNVTYVDNTNPGTATVTITGIGSLTGAVNKTFEITELDVYEVTFNANGGSGSMDPITVVEGNAFTVPECSFTAPIGMVFDTWDVAPVGSNMTVTEDTVFTAQWKENIYPVIIANKTWTEGDANLMVEIDADISKFLYAECDNVTLTEGTDFLLTVGSTIITLTEEYMKKLAPGTHTLTAYFTDGKASWTFTVADKSGGGGKESGSPQTSQPVSGIVLAAATFMAVVALGGIAFIARDEMKKRYDR